MPLLQVIKIEYDEKENEVLIKDGTTLLYRIVRVKGEKFRLISELNATSAEFGDVLHADVLANEQERTRDQILEVLHKFYKDRKGYDTKLVIEAMEKIS